MTERHSQPTLGFDAVVFDMDGVVTRTADLHAASWKELFDDVLRAHSRQTGEAFEPFELPSDYLEHVDGLPRFEGARRFLAARGIDIPEGSPKDDDDAWTIHGIGARKDELFKRLLHARGVEVFASTIALIRELRARGVATAVVTSSRNGREVLSSAGIADLFDARVDGVDAEMLGLPGKPDPAPFLQALRELRVPAARAIVFEDAISGTEAGRRGGFGLVVGVDRGGNRHALEEHGADFVVSDIGEIDADELDARLHEKREHVLAWHIEQEGFDPAREHETESNFAIGNGYLGVRGALDTPLPGSQADLFIAGVYDRKYPERPYSEIEFLGGGRGDYPHAELASAPFPFRLAIALDGERLDLTSPFWRSHRRVLDLQHGRLDARVLYETDADRLTVVRTRRCASLADLHLLLQEVTICLENHSGEVEVDASIADPRLARNHPHLVPLEAEADGAVDVQRFRTHGSGIEICIASRTTLAGSGTDAVRWRVHGTIGEALTFRRYAVVYTSRDGVDPHAEALRHLRALRWEEFDDAMTAHAARWWTVWRAADVRIAGSPACEQALRFNAYHLTSAADRDPRVSVGARALTGRAYEGHVFWDADIFMLPFYLHTAPELAQNHLLYRHRTLDGARRRARQLGLRGACYAWESTVTGDDVTPTRIRLRTTGKEIPIFTGSQQIHVTADVAHGLWRYWEATGDKALMREVGVEILVETARFWASRVTRGPRGYHLRGVVGPDEYHHSVDDNAYTNWMARFNLQRAAEAVAWLKREYARAWGELAERLAVAPDEPEGWAALGRAIYIPQPNRQGVIEQFEGFFDLEDYPLKQEERLEAPLDRLFDWERINRVKLIKQADTVMLLHLFPDAFPRDVVLATYRYYEPLTDHASSLSPGIHAAVAARLGLRDEAERYWRQSLWLDLSNAMSNSALGVHAACMGATWQALVFGFLGVRFSGDGPAVDPEAAARIPDEWQRVVVRLAWRGRRHRLEVVR